MVTPLPAPRAWLVDLDGTLYRPKPLKLAMLAELLLLGSWHAPLLREFRKQHERLRESKAPSVETSPFQIQIALTADRRGIPEERVARVVEEWMFDRPARWLPRFRRDDLVLEIRKFRAGGGCLALVSDYPAQKKLQALGLVDLFELVVANGESSSVKTLKPDPSAFLYAAEQLGIPPSECLVIGDREDADGLAAERAGMAFRLVR